MKYSKTIILSTITIILSSCFSEGIFPEAVTRNLKKIKKHNYIVISSPDDMATKVEIEYLVYDESTKVNTLLKQTKTTPFIIGGENIMIKYDSVVSFSEKSRRYEGHAKKVNHNYTKTGADYLSIKNLSKTNKINFCFVGNEDIETSTVVSDFKVSTQKSDSGFDYKEIIKDSPTPLYKGIPLLYYVKPDRYPSKTYWVELVDGDCGNVYATYFKKIQKPIPITNLNKVIDVYNESNDNFLFLDYHHYFSYKFSCKNKTFKYTNKKNTKFYGEIEPEGEIINKGQIDFINLGWFEVWIINENKF